MTGYLITASFTLFFILIIYRWKVFDLPEIPRWFYGILLVLKLIAGITLSRLLLKYFHGGDSLSYFNDANTLYHLAFTHPGDFITIMTGRASHELTLEHGMKMWNSYELLDFDAQTIIRINALIRFVSFGVYYVHIVFFCFFSLTGLQLFYRLMRRHIWHNRKLFFAVLFLFPSLIFWTSGILKEGVLIAGTGMLLFGLKGAVILHPHKPRLLGYAITGLLIMAFVKPYVLILLLPGIIAWLWSALTTNRNVLRKFLTVYFMYSLLIFNLHYFSPALHATEILYYKQHNSIVFVDYKQSKSIIHPPLIKPDTWSILRQSPASVIQTLIHPSITKAHNQLSWISAFENIFLILCCLMPVLFFRRPAKKSLALLFLSLFFVVSLYAVIGMTTTTAGSLVRYKTPALPFLFFILCLLFDRLRMVQRFSDKKQQNPGSGLCL
ncbi:MAG: hypothetical protein LC117_00220 [Bacteroidia bacterium]|nr:hypothetical protein [Bacteroidia bacterium]MCZ2276340.1 hypothetical protein [Bacteroidia bacterium]